MALKIRMSRGGSKKRPFYRIVVADSRMPRDGRFIEKLGTYNPLLPKADAARLNLDVTRAKHWIAQGARPSDRVARFLDDVGAWTRTPRNNPIKGQPSAKTLERQEAAQAAKQAKQEAKQAAIAAAETATAEAEAAAAEAEAVAAEAPAEVETPEEAETPVAEAQPEQAETPIAENAEKEEKAD